MKVEEYTYKGLTIRINQDEYVESPRIDCCNFGKMACWHNRYNLGDKEKENDDPQELLDSLPKGSIVLPLVLLDHSGLWMRVGNSFAEDPGGWDTSRVGFIYATPDMIRKEYSVKRITPQTREKVEKLLRCEVEVYNQYLTGDVYGFTVEDENGTHLESCWGMYGFDYCKEQAEAMADYAAEHMAAEANAI